MKPSARPQDRPVADDFERELRDLGAVLRTVSDDGPPASADDAIRAAAETAARGARRTGRRWRTALAAAATVTLAVGIGSHLGRDPATPPQPSTGAGPMAAPTVSGVRIAADAPAAAADMATAPAEPRPDPAAWQSRIDALRQAGRVQEAALEERRLDAAWPGWRLRQAAAAP